MKTSIIIIPAAATLFAMANGFAATDCNAGKTINYGEGGNCKCKDWTAELIRYQSDAGCLLTVYEDGDCNGSERVWETRTQNLCQDPGFVPGSIRCC